VAIINDVNISDTAATPEERKALVLEYKARIKSGQVVFTTFHQSYGYEDFIQGLRPVTNSEVMKFANVDGVFKRVADKAMFDNDNNYVIIIDEINRGNISKVFGELITLIETDKRWGEANELSVTLPSGETFAIPNNLYIMGTMNSADKSISLIDTALRRRFDFIETAPNAELVGDTVLRQVLKRLNEELLSELDSTDLLVGHAYFIGKTESDLVGIMNRNIIPLLYEYFFDNSRKVKAVVNKAIENLSYRVEDEKVGRIRIAKKD
jgi:5-methylcytosine-specific restriction protein B